jgi:hypothetical protein
VVAVGQPIALIGIGANASAPVAAPVQAANGAPSPGPAAAGLHQPPHCHQRPCPAALPWPQGSVPR